MNYLIIKPAGASLELALCVGGLTSDIILTGLLTSEGGRLVDASGTELTSLAAPSVASGVAQALAWLSDRNLRVDAVVHNWPLPGANGAAIQAHAGVRLSEESLGRLAASDAYSGVLQTHALVQAWRPACAQAMYLSSPTTPERVVTEISRMGLFAPPAACPQRVRVRCEGCPAGSTQAKN